VGIKDEIAATYNFNDNAQMKLNQTIKNALDPKGILAPGKNGIWPKVSTFLKIKSVLFCADNWGNRITMRRLGLFQDPLHQFEHVLGWMAVEGWCVALGQIF
jgi:FAD linked oxidases, C-terminal domain